MGLIMSEKLTKIQKRVLDAALDVALDRKSWAWVTREVIAGRAGVSAGSVSNAFDGMARLRERVVEEAVARELVPVVAMGIAAGYAAAKGCPSPLKVRALAVLAA